MLDGLQLFLLQYNLFAKNKSWWVLLRYIWENSDLSKRFEPLLRSVVTLFRVCHPRLFCLAGLEREHNKNAAQDEEAWITILGNHFNLDEKITQKCVGNRWKAACLGQGHKKLLIWDTAHQRRSVCQLVHPKHYLSWRSTLNLEASSELFDIGIPMDFGWTFKRRQLWICAAERGNVFDVLVTPHGLLWTRQRAPVQLCLVKSWCRGLGTSKSYVKYPPCLYQPSTWVTTRSVWYEFKGAVSWQWQSQDLIFR